MKYITSSHETKTLNFQRRMTQIENSIFLIRKPGLIEFLKMIGIQD